MIHTKLTERYGIELPFVSAGMGFVAVPTSVQFSYASIPYLTPPRQVVDREWTGSFKGECRESSYVQEI